MCTSRIGTEDFFEKEKKKKKKKENRRIAYTYTNFISLFMIKQEDILATSLHFTSIKRIFDFYKENFE